MGAPEGPAAPALDVVELPLAGLRLIRPRIHRDARGYFVETYKAPAYQAAGIDAAFVQDNLSSSVRGTLRGMHFQTAPGQAKLVRVAHGRIWDVAVDLRAGSPTFGRWHAVELDGEHHHQLYVPVGFAHGFCVLSEAATIAYKVSSVYDPATERGFAYGDPEVGIAWPIAAPLVSPRDAAAPPLREALARAAAAGGAA